MTLDEIARRTWEEACAADVAENPFPRGWDGSTIDQAPLGHPAEGYEYKLWCIWPYSRSRTIAYRKLTLARAVELTELWRT